MIKDYLNQPYPFQVNKWRLIISISIFIGLFMLIFQPFGLSQIKGSYKYLFFLGYGVVTMIIMIFNIILIQHLFKKWFNSWTVLKQIGWLIWIIFCIGLGNFIYTSFFGSHWSWHSFFYFQLFTLSVGFLPIIILTIINQNKLLAENLKSANEFNQRLNVNDQVNEKELVTLIADNEKDCFEVQLSDLLYVESTGNYIEIYYCKDNQLKNELLRSTLKRTELQLELHPSIIKCHRAFLVNANKIVHVKGNSQGLRLALKHTDTEIPVSRNLAKSLKDKLNSTH